jgi:hypothetical protein
LTDDGSRQNPDDLQPFLSIKPPETSRNTPPVLAFQRKREIDIPWIDIIGSADTEGSTSTAAIREYFERSWNLDPEALEDFLKDPSPRIRPTPLDTGTTGEDGQPVLEPMYRTNLDDPQKPAHEVVPEGVVLQHGGSGRFYRILAPPGLEVTIEDFRTPESYEKAWEEKIDGVELVFESAEAASSHYTDFSEIDLRPGIIHRKYNELLLQKQFAASVSSHVAGATEKMIQQIVDSSMDTDELERLQEKSLRLAMQLYEAERRLDRLVTQASDLGYYLFLNGGEFTFPDKKVVKVLPGEMYTKYQRIARWTTQHTKHVYRPKKFLGIKVGTSRQAVGYRKQHSRIVTSFQRVDTSKDPLAEEVAVLRQEGNEVYVFQAGQEGFATSDGIPLASVMDRCEFNEAFRRRCVVMLPVYEEAITGQRTLTKYSVFKRPLRGISPTMLPRLSLVESLSYRTAWRESRLGELVSTINLGPGEQRTVVLSKSFERETAVTTSTTSIFDVSRSETTDLATEMENQARTEKERSSNLQFSTSAEGSYGFVSAQASASGGTSTSLKDFAQAISKVAKRASQSINQQNRQEVTSTSTSRTMVSNRDETTATLHNINEGRSLNLLFYRLHNRFESGIYLDDLQFQVIPSTESIAGSGVYESVRVSLADLPELLEELRQSRLPFRLASQSREEYLARVLDSLEKILAVEYEYSPEEKTGRKGSTKTTARGGKEPSPALATQSVGLLHLPPKAPQAVGVPAAPTGVDGQLRRRVEELSGRLRKATLERDTPIQPDSLMLVSDGLYLDTAVGALPGTEPYSEEMRIQEVRMRAAEVFAKEADGAYRLALAARLGHSATGATGNWLTGILPDMLHGKSLSLSLKQPLPNRKWALMVDGDKKAVLSKKDIADKWVLSLSWDEEQDWLKSDNLLLRTVLMDEESGQVVGFPV